MAIGRLQASLAAATNEVTIAAANINFDFTLVKNVAPKEYQVLGHHLSTKRKEQAEFGTLHVTARRLGALFEGVCPHTPKLVQAYGTRVSEIAEAAKEKNPSEDPKSIFADHSGIDGTSIWAAATSSVTALHVQLLACMLARLWNGPEAISVWVELIEGRRQEIASKFENEGQLPFSTYTAAVQGEISRSHIADWDASARAWLRTADAVKKREQKQLMLILENIDLPVDEDKNVLSSVIAAWTSALKSMELLISGSPQGIHGGPTLLGLSAWHIYPDMIVLGGENPEICMEDPLVAPGGIFTIGIRHSGGNRGVYWSLSLAHLRYYGRAVQKYRHIHIESSRITFPQFQQAALGCILSYWGITGSSTLGTTQLLLAIEAELDQELDRTDGKSWVCNTSKVDVAILKNSSHWFRIFANAVSGLFSDDDQERTIASKLLRFGQRRWQKFMGICDLEEGASFFGLTCPEKLIRCLKSTEERIAYLRFVARQSRDQPELVIKYYHSERDQSARAPFPSYASALPICGTSRKRKLNHSGTRSLDRHTRWLPRKDYNGLAQFDGEDSVWQTSNQFFCKNHEYLGETIRLEISPDSAVHYAFLCGDPAIAALYTRYDTFQDYRTTRLQRPSSSIEDILKCLKSGWLSIPALASHINRTPHFSEKASRTLLSLCIAERVYRLLPDATIAIEAFDSTLCESSWAKSIWNAESTGDGYLPKSSINLVEHLDELLSGECALSCVAHLESGFCDVSPSQLHRVVGLSSDDSLYVSMQLLCDPYEKPRPYELRRILGNVGKAGISMLVTPKYPMVRERCSGSWSLINHADFDGRAEDHFGRTSLHLSFTKYQMPIYVGGSGSQDSEIHFLECVVSVYDSCNWVADIDVMFARNHPMVLRWPQQPPCQHNDSPLMTSDCVSVENWDEIIDRPTLPFVIRANGNWIARLAATAVLVQIVPKDIVTARLTLCAANFCWKCNVDLYKRLGLESIPAISKMHIC